MLDRGLLVEQHQSRPITFFEDEVTDRSGQHRRVTVLGEARPFALIAHAGRAIDDHRAAEIGLGLVALEHQAIAASEHLPIEMADVIAGDIGAMIGKVDAVPLVRTAMGAGTQAFDDDPGNHFQAMQPGEIGRADKGRSGGVEHGRSFGT